MSADHVTRPEFDIYVKMTAEAMASIAESTKESLSESRETNQILREHTIHNNNKIDAINQRITALGLEVNSVKKTVLEREGAYNIIKAGKWAFVILLGGALTVWGGLLATQYWNDTHEPKNSVKKEVTK